MFFHVILESLADFFFFFEYFDWGFIFLLYFTFLSVMHFSFLLLRRMDVNYCTACREKVDFHCKPKLLLLLATVCLTLRIFDRLCSSLM